MIIMFGASSDIGRRATAHLLDAGHAMRLISRRPESLDPRAQHVAGDVSNAYTVTEGADVVVSCAHARHTQKILAGLGSRRPMLVLVGSTWRYSKVYEPGGHEVLEAELIFTESGRDGVMLHPTMINGGAQENNLRHLLAAIRRWPVLPVPGGGLNLVQPIFVDDVALCIAAAATRKWSGPHVVPICGPTPMRWRDMARACASAIGYYRPIFPIPLALAIKLLIFARQSGIYTGLHPNVLRRLQEDATFSSHRMQGELGVVPCDFTTGLTRMLAEDAADH